MSSEHQWFMQIALEQAQKAEILGEVPVGAVVVDAYGKVLSSAHNLKEKTYDPCGHAEIIALREAAKIKKQWRLSGVTLYVTLEPCLMCLSAMVHARIERLIFGAYDLKGGSLSLGHDFYKDRRLNHNFNVIGGMEHFRCSQILSNFFKARRNQYCR